MLNEYRAQIKASLSFEKGGQFLLFCEVFDNLQNMVGFIRG